MGRLYGVSVGAGDPRLMTLKAVDILEKCAVIAVPRTKGENNLAMSIAQQAADLSGKRVIYLDIPMTRDMSVLDDAYDSIAEKLSRELENNDVAVPTLGDISVYSTFSPIARRVEQLGFDTEICAGVTSFSAAAAALKLSLCRGDQPLHIIPYGCDDLEQLLDARGTKVIMKTGGHAHELMELLRKKGLAAQTAAVESCGLPNEKIYLSCETAQEEFGYFTVFIVRDGEK